MLWRLREGLRIKDNSREGGWGSMRALIIGDTHIPRRAEWLPEEIDRFITSQNFDIVICTGDLTDKSVYDYLRDIGGELYVVSGNMDHLDLPEKQVFEVAGVKVGVVHGHQVYPRGNRSQLKRIGRDLGVNVLVHGHTHTPDVHFDEILLLNPGSATGVWSGGGGSLIPSFMILEFSGKEVGVKLYELKDRLKVNISDRFKVF